jgi:hypothetical protein
MSTGTCITRCTTAPGKFSNGACPGFDSENRDWAGLDVTVLVEAHASDQTVRDACLEERSQDRAACAVRAPDGVENDLHRLRSVDRDVVGVGGAGGADSSGRAGLVDGDAFGEDGAGSRTGARAATRPARLPVRCLPRNELDQPRTGRSSRAAPAPSPRRADRCAHCTHLADADADGRTVRELAGHAESAPPPSTPA